MTLYYSYKQALEVMGNKQRLELFDAITDYGFYGELRFPLSPKNAPIFDLIRPTLDNGAKKAANALKAAAKRKQNSCKPSSKGEEEIEEEFENELEKELEIELESETDCSNGSYSDPFFMEFFNAYPISIDEYGARQAWEELNPDAACREQIAKSLDSWKKSSRWAEQGGRYIPHASTFLKKNHWQTICDNTPKQSPGLCASGTLGEFEKQNILSILSYPDHPASPCADSQHTAQ